MLDDLKKEIFLIDDENTFEKLAIRIFRYQVTYNPIYKEYVSLLGRDIHTISRITDIPFLPIEFFKTHRVVSGNYPIKKVFTSSGTTGVNTSSHFLSDTNIYETSFRKGFELFYGDIKDYCILALLPSYLEREGSSLIYMMNDLVTLSGHPDSGFYLDENEKLVKKITELEKKGQKMLLLGVTFALLELAEKYTLKLKNTIVMETGGMKGRRDEITKDQLHRILKEKFGVASVHSEYGMTELLSQAYSNGDNIFSTPPWMKILIRDTNDPFIYMPEGRSGGINVIDLANVDSCSFIETKDLGRILKGNRFEVLGRFDNTDIRGCNLLVLN